MTSADILKEVLTDSQDFDIIKLARAALASLTPRDEIVADRVKYAIRELASAEERLDSEARNISKCKTRRKLRTV